ncbi:MAG: hypothetical protein ACPL7K_06315 [Armatimonadota bacterium]
MKACPRCSYPNRPSLARCFKRGTPLEEHCGQAKGSAADYVVLTSVYGVAPAGLILLVFGCLCLSSGIAISGMISLLIPWALLLLLYRRPLTQWEIDTVARNRRRKAVAQYFRFSHEVVSPNPTLKSTMDREGRFYRGNLPMSRFPAYAAGLLKYKKHEWIIFAFAKNGRVTRMWANKGSRECATPTIPATTVIETARSGGFDTVLCLHNHPNPNPRYYIMSRPSDADLEFAQYWSELASRIGMNVVLFVCERGRAHLYATYVWEGFMPVSQFRKEVAAQNGLSASQNLSLHCERLLPWT